MASGYLGGGGNNGPGALVQWAAGAGIVILVLVALFGPVTALIKNLLTLYTNFLRTIAPPLATAMVLTGLIGGAVLMFTHKRHAWRLAACGVVGGIVVGVAVAASDWLTGGSGLGTHMLNAGESLTSSIVSSIQSGGSTTP